MRLEDLKIGDVIGVDTGSGDQFFKATERGIEGPFLDRDCTIPYMNPEMRAELRRNAGLERHYHTGLRRRMKEFTFTDGTKAHTDHRGVIHRDAPRLSKKERRRAKRQASEESQNPDVQED